MYRKNALLTLVLITSLLLPGCSSDDKSTETITEKTVKSTPSVVQTQTPTSQPKTGEIKKDGESANKDFVFPVEGVRPVAVMIDNEGTKSLPQGGLDKAQIIYELIVEGGESRLMPVFWNTDPQLIGPVRSSRHYFLDYAMEHDAIYTHFGYSPRAMQDISRLKINNINGVANGGEIFWDLTKDRYNWQDSYTSMEKIKSYINKVKYRTNTGNKLVFAYNKSDGDLPEGEKAEKIDIRYSASYTCGFNYDPSNKSYKRLRKGKPHMERTTNLQLEAKNIIIQIVPNHRIEGDTADRQDLGNVGSGSGWYITDGKSIKIKWSKESRSAPTKYTDQSGSPILLNPGQTWVEVTPAGGKVLIE